MAFTASVCLARGELSGTTPVGILGCPPNAQLILKTIHIMGLGDPAQRMLLQLNGSSPSAYVRWISEALGAGAVQVIETWEILGPNDFLLAWTELGPMNFWLSGTYLMPASSWVVQGPGALLGAGDTPTALPRRRRSRSGGATI